LPNATIVVDHFYDDLRVMPTWSVLPLVGAVSAVARSA
jgi:hypothetical protein